MCGCYNFVAESGAVAEVFEVVTHSTGLTPRTTAPNELVALVHDRMPVILPRDCYAEWLDPDTPERRLDGVARPEPGGTDP
jgi:putative SOS response-associated peptidase YedK